MFIYCLTIEVVIGINAHPPSFGKERVGNIESYFSMVILPSTLLSTAFPCFMK